jgi:hypothetical protein
MVGWGDGGISLISIVGWEWEWEMGLRIGGD